MFFGGYFVRSSTLLTIPFIFPRPPPPSFPYIGFLLRVTGSLVRDALAIVQCFWPLLLAMFCISLFASFVQQHIFAFIAFSFRKLWGWSVWVKDHIVDRLPSNWIKGRKRNSAVLNRPRSGR